MIPADSWWCAQPEQNLPDGTAWLSPGELSYADSRRFTKRRVEFLVARYTAKATVGQVLGFPGSMHGLRRVEIRHEPSGAPFLCVDGEPATLRMSLTDRAGWAVCLVSARPFRVGCDLELVEPRSAGFVRDFFTAAEQDYVAGLTGDEDRHLAANLIWSAKESALKVLTTGLRRDTRSVEVSVDGTGAGWQPLRISTAEGALFPGWWRRLGEFVLTVAGEQPLDPPQDLPGADRLTTARPRHDWLAHPSVR